MNFNPYNTPGFNPVTAKDTITPALMNYFNTQSEIAKFKIADEANKIQEFKALTAFPLVDMDYNHKKQFYEMRDSFEKDALKIYSEAKGRPNFEQIAALDRKKGEMMLLAQHSNWLKQRGSQVLEYVIKNAENIEPESMKALDNWVKGLDANGNKMKIEDTPDPMSLIKTYPDWDYNKFMSQIEAPIFTDSKRGAYVDAVKTRSNVAAQFEGISGQRNFRAGVRDGRWTTLDEAINKVTTEKINQMGTKAQYDKTGSTWTFNMNNGTWGDPKTRSYTFQPAGIVPPDDPNSEYGGIVFNGTKPQMNIGGGEELTPEVMYYNKKDGLVIEGKVKKVSGQEATQIEVKKDELKGKDKNKILINEKLYQIREDGNGKFFLDEDNKRIDLTDGGDRYKFELKSKGEKEEWRRIPVNKIKAALKTWYGDDILNNLEKSLNASGAEEKPTTDKKTEEMSDDEFIKSIGGTPLTTK